MRSLKAAVVLGVSLVSLGCTPEWARENETGILMEIAGIEGVAGGAQGGAGSGAAILFSDVSVGGTSINDDALVTVNIYRKNPTVASTSALEHVRLESYQVRYLRSDGRNVEGVDVPHRITGPLNSLRFHTPKETGEVEVEAVINIVRQTAKREPPLMNLVGGVRVPTTGSILFPSEGLLFTSAEITIYARQVTTGEALSATGRMQVAFGDFADDGQ